ncbi:putative protein FAR1-RELATED SEQUENCE 10 [Glycine max]|nr:putative protein FAR1-RELATED SEQUENCE 10 [Glycine max]
MDEDQWAYYSVMSEEVDMDFQNEEDCGVNETHVDCSDAFNTSQVFETREDVLKWARTVAHENGFVAVIVRSDTYTGSRGRTSFVLIGCERSGKYKGRKKEFVRRDTSTRKCGCPFKIRGKPVHGGEGWAVKLICGIHNHELAKTLVGHPYAGRLTDDEKNIIVDMTKSNVKPRNILLTLKEHNSSSCTTIKQIYNARSAYRSSIRGDDSETQHLMRLLERDQYIHWHRLKDEDVVRDLFWCHPDAVKLCNACHLVFLIDSTYKTNRYRLPLHDIVGVTPTGMTFSAGFAYLEGERVNNLVWALERFRGLFLRNDRLPVVIVTDRDLALVNAVKVVFPECKNLLCRFHIDKNVKAKSKSLVGQKNAWDYVMDSWGNLVDCPSEQEFPKHLQRFQVACSPWPMFTDYVCETWIVPHKEKFILAWTNKVMHLGNTTTNRVESAHWSLKRILQNSVEDLCSVWDAMNNMMTLKHTEIRASFETSMHVGSKQQHLSQTQCIIFCTTEASKDDPHVSMDKWMDITDMGYVIASRYNVILVSLSRQQSLTFFPLRSRPPADSATHRIICVGHVYGSHFVQVFLKDRSPLPPIALLWSSNAYPEAKQWPTTYVGRMQQYLSLMTINTTHVDLSGH